MSPALYRGARMTPASSKRVLWSVMAFALMACVGGCAPKPLYHWGHYEESLQASYIAHDESKAWSSLEATITSAEQTGRRIPPGASAEYGFLLYQRGQRERAIEYFEREAQLFPESKPLMEKLIAKVREQVPADQHVPTEGGARQ